MNADFCCVSDLRKILRCLLNEQLLFSDTAMFPDDSNTEAGMAVLDSTRFMLGDLNDDWTAYAFYVAHRGKHFNREALEQQIGAKWREFQSWSAEVDLTGSLQSLAASMANPPCKYSGRCGNLHPAKHSTQASFDPHGTGRTTLTLNEFLVDRKHRPTRHLVIGNEAGDADSIVSAIALSYIESTQGVAESTPILSIGRGDLETQRPETKLLLQLAGVSVDELIFDDTRFVAENANGANVTLVDHNRLEPKFRHKSWTVVAIVDHHLDERYYRGRCAGDARIVAFANGRALVASACTLVAERQRALWTPPYAASVGTLLIGTILLDSFNIDPAAGKVTERDENAVRDLLFHTAWSELDNKTKHVLRLAERPDTDAFYRALEGARYDAVFWGSLSMHDALRLDYKHYGHRSSALGISSVLMASQDFRRKANFEAGLRAYMHGEAVTFLGVMLTSMDDDNGLNRQLALCAFDSFPLQDMVEFLLQPVTGLERESLELVELAEESTRGVGLTIRFFDQGNTKASRKQIAPSLLAFFERPSM